VDLAATAARWRPSPSYSGPACCITSPCAGIMNRCRQRFAGMMDGVALRGPRLPIARTYALATSMLGVAETAGSEIRRGTTIPAARQLMLALAGCIGYLARRPGFRTPKPGNALRRRSRQCLIQARAPMRPRRSIRHWSCARIMSCLRRHLRPGSPHRPGRNCAHASLQPSPRTRAQISEEAATSPRTCCGTSSRATT